ncbi:MAG: NADH-quinone oxidoreductase subunit C [Cyclobacteriaceae bacterium]|nr:NADH-quinone oxidoreductase subunit C [Cyclobacteriaceae bacterium]
MNIEQLTAWVTALVPDQKPGVSKQFAECIVPAGQLHQLCKDLRDNRNTQMDYLFCETAVDRKDGFHMVYHMKSTILQHTLVIRVILTDKINPEVVSVSDLWHGAEFFEREIFDLFGIRFTNHPDLRRLFLEEDWVGYPLRKDYKDSFTLER